MMNRIHLMCNKTHQREVSYMHEHIHTCSLSISSFPVLGIKLEVLYTIHKHNYTANFMLLLLLLVGGGRREGGTDGRTNGGEEKASLWHSGWPGAYYKAKTGLKLRTPLFLLPKQRNHELANNFIFKHDYNKEGFS